MNFHIFFSFGLQICHQQWFNVLKLSNFTFLYQVSSSENVSGLKSLRTPDIQQYLNVPWDMPKLKKKLQNRRKFCFRQDIKMKKWRDNTGRGYSPLKENCQKSWFSSPKFQSPCHFPYLIFFSLLFPLFPCYILPKSHDIPFPFHNIMFFPQKTW